MSSHAPSADAVLTTSDGVPLKVSLNRTLRRNKMISLALVAPLLIFIVVSFLIPIVQMLLRSIDNGIVIQQLPLTVEAIKAWDPEQDELPSEAIFSAILKDIQAGAKTKTINRVGKRFNYQRPGMSSLFRKSARKVKRLKDVSSAKTALQKIDKRWVDPGVWRLIKRESGKTTSSYYLAAVDAKKGEHGDWRMRDEDKQIYLTLFGRTLWLSVLITGLTILFGYPIAYLLATLPVRISNMLMILVLLPFWTSLLVRTTSWIVLLQKEGVINDLLVWLGIISDDGRLAMIYNQIGTSVAMTHILLPFMVLPLYSVMKTIPPSYMRAARSLGATPFTAFVRIYMPNTIPGIGAGAILVFIISIGYYITPALVGGVSGTFVSNFIAYHISQSLNWGLAAALGTLLLLLVLALYFLYDKIVGIDNMKLG